MDQRFLVFALVVVPVLSVCLGFTVHYAIRPMVQTLVDAIHDLSSILARPPVDDDVLSLRAEIDRLRDEVRELRAGQEFDRNLLGTSTDRPRP
ncbi:MAG: hypothetical protein RLN75_04805 [Longimicrobiales bacterium]